MLEKLYNIPINDAVNAGDECPFCYIERSIEQDLMDFVLGSGSTYMEADVREKTDKAGFCKIHYKKMLNYGNTLGNAWIMKTYLRNITKEAETVFKEYKPTSNGLKAMFGKNEDKSINAISRWIQKKQDSCFICAGFKDHYDRYMKTFFEMYDRDRDFSERLKGGKGFCLPHFGDLLEYAGRNLPEKKQQEFAGVFIPLMKEKLEELYGDVSWLIEKFDYVNKDADWKNSRDALQRSMQRMKGGYPGDGVYTAKK